MQGPIVDLQCRGSVETHVETDRQGLGRRGRRRERRLLTEIEEAPVVVNASR
jgi:hypothetical protein